MKALANENFPAPSTRILRAAGWDVKSIKETMPGISDEEVLQVTVAEKRIILTFDRDYGELLFRYRHAPPPAVVYFRSKGDTPESAGRLLLDIAQRQHIILQGFFTVVEDSGVRQRQFR